MRRTIFLPLILAFSVFIAQPHTAIAQGGQDVVRWLEELGRTAGFEVTAKDVSQEGDAIVVGSIDIRLSEKIGFSATDARIEGFKTDPSGGVSTSKISVGKITSIGSAAWKITFGDISGARLSFAATGNLPTLLSEEYRQLNAISSVLLSLSAEQLDIASIELDLPEFFQQAQKSIYRGVYVRDYDRGKIDTLSIASVNQKVTQGKFVVHSSSEGYENRGINLVTVAEVFAPSAYANGKGNRDWALVQSSGKIARSRVKTDGISYAVKDMTFEGFALRQFKTAGELAGFVEVLGAIPSLSKPANPDAKQDPLAESENLQNTLKFLTLLDIFRLERAEASSLEMKATIPDAPEFEMALGKFEIKQFAGIGFDEIAIENIGVKTAGRQVFQNETFVMRGLRTSNFSNLKDIIAAETKAKSKGERFEPSAKQLRALIPTLERLSLGGMMIVPYAPASANDAGVISLKNVDVSMDDHIGPIPTKMNIVVNGFSMPSAVVPDLKAQAGLQALGYIELAGDLQIDLNWDEATNTLNASEVSIDAKDAAKISIKASLNGIPRALFEDPEKNAMAATFASLADLDIKISNNSLIERALKIAASDLQQDPDNLKKLIVAQAGQFLAALGNEEFSTRALSELRAFLNDPVSLKLSAAPLNPVPILQLGILAQGSPGLLVQMLNVQVRANN